MGTGLYGVGGGRNRAAWGGGGDGARRMRRSSELGAGGGRRHRDSAGLSQMGEGTARGAYRFRRVCACRMHAVEERRKSPLSPSGTATKALYHNRTTRRGGSGHANAFVRWIVAIDSAHWRAAGAVSDQLLLLPAAAATSITTCYNSRPCSTGTAVVMPWLGLHDYNVGSCYRTTETKMSRTIWYCTRDTPSSRRVSLPRRCQSHRRRLRRREVPRASPICRVC